jgi:hypothetical protein
MGEFVVERGQGRGAARDQRGRERGQGLIAAAPYSGTFTNDPGTPHVQGNFLFVLERAGDDWKIRVFAAARTVAPPPPKRSGAKAVGKGCCLPSGKRLVYRSQWRPEPSGKDGLRPNQGWRNREETNGIQRIRVLQGL